MATSFLDILLRVKDQASKALKKTKDEVKKLNEEFEDLDDQKTDGAEKEVKSLAQALDEAAQELEKNARGFNALRNAALAVTGIGAAIAAPFIAGVKSASAFSIKIAEIETLVDSATTSNEELRQTVLNLSSEFGQDRLDVAQGLYQAISSGARAGAEANEVLRVALITARGGVTSVASAVEGLSTIMNAFGLATGDAERIADSLFTAVKGGRTTIQELSQFLFQAAPLAATLGVKFTDLNAALVAVTKQGVPTRNAFTQIRAAFQGIIRDTPELNALFGEFGGAANAIRKIGLPAVFQLVRDSVGGSEGALIKLIGSIEGANAILATTGENAGFFTDAMLEQEDALGAAAEAAAKVEEAFGVKFEKAFTQVTNLFTELGNTIGPTLAGVAEVVGAFAEQLTKLIQVSDSADTVIGVTAALGGLIALLGGSAAIVLTAARGFAFLKGSMSAIATTVPAAARTVGVLTKGIKLLTFAVSRLFLPLSLILFAYDAFAAENDELQQEIEETTERLAEAEQGFNDLNAAAKVEVVIDAENQVANIERQLNILRRRKKEIETEGVGIFGAAFGGSSTAQLAEVLVDIEQAEQDLAAAAEQADNFNEKLDTINKKGLRIEDEDRLERSLKLANTATENLQGNLDKTQERIDELTNQGGDAATFEFNLTFDPTEVLDVSTALRDEQLTQEQIRARLEARRREIARLNEELAIVRQLKQEELDRDAASAAAETEKARVERLKEELALIQANNKLVTTRLQNELKLAKLTGREDTRELQEQLRNKEITEEEFLNKREQQINRELELEKNLITQRIIQAEQVRDQRLAQLGEGTTDAEKEQIARKAATITAAAQSQIETLEGQLVTSTEKASQAVAAAGRKVAITSLETTQATFERVKLALIAEIQSIQAALDTGLISPATAQQQIADAQARQAATIRSTLIPAVEEYFAKTKDPQALIFLEMLNAEMERLEGTTSAFAQALTAATETALAGFFEETLKNIDNVSEAFDAMIQNIGDSIRRLIAERLANKLIESLFGSEDSILGGFLSKDGGEVAAGGGYIRAKGGGIMKLAEGGGKVKGKGTKTSDSVGPVYLSAGEYVMRAKAVDQYGLQMMEAINQGIAPSVRSPRRLGISRPKKTRFADGGVVGSPPTVQQLTAGASAVGQAVSKQAPGELVLNVPESTLNSMMRDVLEREFGRILKTR